jgi:hypothetical protein
MEVTYCLSILSVIVCILKPQYEADIMCGLELHVE